MYLDDAKIWTQAEDWRKFTKRGVMLARSAFDAIRGFQHEYLRFAEMVAAAALRDNGFRLGYAPDACIVHHNSTKLSELLDYCREYCVQACAYEQQYPGVIDEARHHLSAANASRHDVRVLVYELRCISHAWRLSWKKGAGRALRYTMLSYGFRTLLRLLMGQHLNICQLWTRYSFGRVRLLIARLLDDEERCYGAFREVWHRTGRLAAARHQTRDRKKGDSLSYVELTNCWDGHLQLADCPSDAFIGFHAVESGECGSFRWASPVATIRLREAPCDRMLTLGIVIRSIDMANVRVYLNGQPCEQELVVEGQQIFRIRREQFGTGELQHLTIVTEKLRGCSPLETRDLGIPLSSIHFAPSANQIISARRKSSDLAIKPTIS